MKHQLSRVHIIYCSWYCSCSWRLNKLKLLVIVWSFSFLDHDCDKNPLGDIFKVLLISYNVLFIRRIVSGIDSPFPCQFRCSFFRQLFLSLCPTKDLSSARVPIGYILYNDLSPLDLTNTHEPVQWYWNAFLWCHLPGKVAYFVRVWSLESFAMERLCHQYFSASLSPGPNTNI